MMVEKTSPRGTVCDGHNSRHEQKDCSLMDAFVFDTHQVDSANHQDSTL